MKLLLGDCLDKLKELDDNSVDSIVTDPPYGLSFMGKKWDYDVPKKKIWKECMRVLKPGGYLLAFAGSRTYHRMAIRIEDAGFEIRDQIMWIYGSGFPKSMNIGKGIDKKFGAEREVIGTKGLNSYKTKEQGHDYGNLRYDFDKVNELTAPATDEAKQWEGWGTALKPAHEPIVMARKPLSEKTVVDNVLEWGTGGINIEDSRIPSDYSDSERRTSKTGVGIWNKGTRPAKEEGEERHNPNGRFPANLIFDEEAGRMLDEQTGELKSGDMPGKYKGWGKNGIYGSADNELEHTYYGDSGGASRFFYCPKTSKTDRNEGLEHLEDKLTQGIRANAGPALVGDDESGRTTAKNNHPTVKPTDLMLYLIRLVTPKGGTTLDPFMGSGSTGKAAVRGGFDFVGIEREDEYMEIAEARIQYEQDNPYNEEKGERIELNKNSQKFW
jgi:DNA modification methylase